MKKLLSALILIFVISLSMAQNSIEKIDINFDEGHVFSKNVFGVNNNLITRPFFYTEPDFIRVFEDLGSPCIRFPGGTGANFYNWETGMAVGWEGISASHQDKVNSLNASIISKFGNNPSNYLEFCEFIKTTEAEFTLVLNIAGLTPADNKRWMEAMKEQGVDVKNVEIGNELYHGAYDDIVKDIDEYLEACKLHSTAVKAVFPDVKIGVMLPAHIYVDGSFLTSDESGTDKKQLDWWDKLYPEDFYDALVLHMYSRVGMLSAKTEADFIPFKEGYRNGLSNSDGKFFGVMDSIQNRFPEKELWVTEWGIASFGSLLNNYKIVDTYLSGLFKASFFLKLMSQANLTLSSNHNMVNIVNYSKVNNAYQFTGDADYKMYQPFAEPVENTDKFVLLKFNDLLNYKGGEGFTEYDFPDVEGGLFYSEDTAYMVLVNKMDNNYTLSADVLSNALAQSDSELDFKVTEYGPSKNLSLDEALDHESEIYKSSKTAMGESLQLNPYSMYLIEVEGFKSGIVGVTNKKMSSVNVYPNPFHNHFTISDLRGKSNISLYDLSGRLLHQQRTSESKCTLNPNIKNGIYLMKVNNNDGESTHRILKQSL